MNRNVRGLANVILIALMLAGVWLANYSDTGLLIGLLLVVGAAAGIIVLARQENSLPLGQGEREGWRIVRARGKRHYVLRSVMRGLFVGVVFLLYQVIKWLWSGEPFTVSSGFLLIVLFIILYIGGSYYAAIKKWALYEARYKDALPTRGAA